MKKLIDIINFNADASCLSSKKWLNCLKGGIDSKFCQWLNLYVLHKKCISLGLTGATIADLCIYNHEAIDIINNNRHIFEILLRPFAHDIALFRTYQGFITNITYGKKIIINTFKEYSNFFLPPEFMCTSLQIQMLSKMKIEGVFINSSRFNIKKKERIPIEPYYVRGLFASKLKCIPIFGNLTDEYLLSLQRYSYDNWNNIFDTTNSESIYFWRDGESPFLLPDGIQREDYWLSNESNSFQRIHLKDIHISYCKLLKENMLKTYPIHQFSSWIKEMRMLWFINRVQNIENHLKSLTKNELYLWLQVINSDILSAVEKNSPVVLLKKAPNSKWFMEYLIKRSERGFEGEEYLELLENYSDINKEQYLKDSNESHITKLIGRMRYLKMIDS